MAQMHKCLYLWVITDLLSFASFTFKSSEVKCFATPIKSNLHNSAFTRSSLLKVFCKKGAFRNFAKFAGKHLCQGLFRSQRVATLLKKRFWHRCFPMNFAKFPRTLFLTEHLWWLLLFYCHYQNHILDPGKNLWGRFFCKKSWRLLAFSR